MTAGMIAVFVGYTVGSYGVCLLRDYNVPWLQWINPLNPWVWPAGTVPPVPSGQIFPSADAAITGGAGHYPGTGGTPA